MRENRTKIIATIGPACKEKSVLLKMMQAGMDAARLNFSHGTYEEFSKIIKNLRYAAKKMKKEIAIIQDLQGPKLRIGIIKNGAIEVKKGQKIILGKGGVPLQFTGLPRYTRKRNRIFIDDGKIELLVKNVNRKKQTIACVVKIPGIIKSNKGMNLPDTRLPFSAITKKDIKDVLFGIKKGVDYAALSFTGNSRDIKKLREILRKQGGNQIKIIAKIERKEALKNLEDIVKVSDAVMVARGDLGIELPAEMVPLHQKKIIYACQKHGKPVIVATQMLMSMTKNPKPTRAEISDAANTIFEYADAMMLSDETAIGKYPIEAVKILAKVAGAVEKELRKYPYFQPEKHKELMTLTDAACLSAVNLASSIKAKYIIALTKTGYTAREIAKNRPLTPVIVFTPSQKIARHLSVIWGVNSVFAVPPRLPNPLPFIKRTLKKSGLVHKKDIIVICNTSASRKEKLLTSAVIE